MPHTVPTLPQAEARANAIAACGKAFAVAAESINHAINLLQRDDDAQEQAYAAARLTLRELTTAFNRLSLFPPMAEFVDPKADTAVIRRRVEAKLVCGYCDCVGHIASACPKIPH